MLISTYVLAQVLYRKTSGRWLLPLAPILRLCALLVRPLTAILGFFQSLVELSEPAKTNEEGPGPTGDIEALISAGEEEGIIEKDDRKLIESVVAFGDKTVREVMTPRPKIVAIEANRSLEDLRELVIHEQYSRVPVYERTIDNIIGFVHVRDMFELDEAARHGRRVKELTRPIRFVPETKPVNDLLREMQQDGAHMAIVIDEYGNTAGLATMEDMVEEILGEIHDEHEPERDVLKQPDGSFVVAGSVDLDRLHDLLEFRPPEETESTTIGGLVTEWLGHVPHIGEVIERDGIRLEVLAGDELKVEQVRVSKVSARNRARDPFMSETIDERVPFRVRFPDRPPQRRQIHPAERADRRKARHRFRKAADHAHHHSRRGESSRRSNRLHRHAWHPQIHHAIQQAHDGDRADGAGRSRRAAVCGRRIVPFSAEDSRSCLRAQGLVDARPVAGEQNRPRAGQAQTAAVHRAIQGGPRIRRIHPGVGHHGRRPGSCARRDRLAAPGRTGLLSRPTILPINPSGSWRPS